MAARERTLARIREALASRPAPGHPAAVQRPGAPVRPRAPDLDLFTARAELAACSVERVLDAEAVPDAVARYVRARGQGEAATILDDALWARYAWDRAPEVHWARGPLAPDGDLLVTGCEAAVAEEGAIVLAGDDREAASPFLALDHVVVVRAGQLVPSLASLWPVLRDRFAGQRWPRHLTVVLGPSRTADLGVPSRLGAHGPAAVHILLVAESGLRYDKSLPAGPPAALPGA